MAQTYKRCKTISTPRRYEPPPRGPIDPKSCPCALVAEPPVSVEEINGHDTAATPLSPKASFENIDKPPVDELEIIIFLERILNVFGRTIKKLELAAALPTILDDSEVTEVIGKAEMKKIKRDLGSGVVDDDTPWAERRERWQRRRQTEKRHKIEGQTLLGSSCSVSRKSFDESETTSSESACSAGEASENSKIYKALQLLGSFPAIRDKVTALIRANDISPQSNSFLQHVKYFFEHCLRRIRFSPARDNVRNVHFRNLWHENHKAQRDIDGIPLLFPSALVLTTMGLCDPVNLTKSRMQLNQVEKLASKFRSLKYLGLLDFLDEQRTKNHDLTKQIAARYRKDCDTVESFDGKCMEDVKSTVDRYEKKQIAELRYAELRRSELSRDLAIATTRLNNLREANQSSEQEIGSRRFKVMSQLSGQITRFDTEIGERYRVLQELIGEFDANEEIRKDLEEETKRQSDECNVFLARIEEQRLAILQEKLTTFVQNRAAKIIQRWWRPIYRRRRKLRKKKKKGKKKKKK